jgi:uncharacterized membrane protein YbhN (UPF0104 family)
LLDGGTAPGTEARRALLRRLALPAAGVAVVAVLVLTARGPAQAFADAVARAASADARWFAAAVVLELLSFTGYIALLWHVAGRRSPRVGLRASYEMTLAGAAATRLLPTAGAGGAAVTLWALRRAGLRDREGTRTLLTFLVVLYAVFLLAVAITGTLVASGAAGGHAPLALSLVPAAGALAAMAIAVALMAHRPRGLRFARAADAGALLGDAMRDAAALVRRGDPRLLGALGWWGFDVAVLYATFSACGTPPPLAVLVLGYFVGQVANTIPVPGAASGGMVGVLIAFGVPAGLALPSVLAYRAIAIWTPAPAGAAALAALRRRAAGWTRDDQAEGVGERPSRLAHRLAPRPRGRAVAPRAGVLLEA